MRRWIKAKNNRGSSKRYGSLFKPFLEVLEDRRLLSSGNGFVQGYVLDQSSNPVANATVELLTQSNLPLSPPVSTSTNSQGYYSITGIAAGTYNLVELPPAGYQNAGTSANTLTNSTNSALEPATQLSPSTIQVTIPPEVGNPSSSTPQVTTDFDVTHFINSNNWVNLYFNVLLPGNTTPTAENDQAGQFNISVTEPTTSTTTMPVNSFCVDLDPTHQFNSLGTATFTANVQTDTSGMGPTQNSGQIGYVFDHYGNGTTPLGAVDGAAVQLAIWELEYDPNVYARNSYSPSNQLTTAIFTSGNGGNFVITNPNDPNVGAVEQETVNILNQTFGLSEPAFFLNPTGFTADGEQGMIVPEILNFTNSQSPSPPPSPNVGTFNTTPGNTVVLGSGNALSDSATLSGNFVNPTGTITFYLYAPGQPPDTLNDNWVFRDVVTVNGNGTYNTTTQNTPTSVVTNNPGPVPTQTGVYAWAAVYSGDANNQGATSPYSFGNGTIPEPENAVNANISITPNAIDPVNDAETFTITVTAAPAGTTPSFATPTVSFVGTPPSTVGPVTFVSQSGDVATYTVTINNATPGTFVIDASDVVTFTDGSGNTVMMTAMTNGTGGNSGPATKNYVNANISITPNAIDPVNDTETFTITATALTAPSSGVTFNFATPTVSFVGAPPGTVDPVTFVSQSGNVATYTVTIASSSVGTFVINASDVVSFTDPFGDTTSVTATTSGTGGNSGPATKNYVNANISITPNAIDPINDTETFTITATALTAPSSGVTFGFLTPTVSFVGAPPGTVGPVTFVSQTGNVATYTVTIASSSVGTFVINATDTVNFTDSFGDTTSVTATTSGTGGNSGPATKNYVNANISITPNAIDPINDTETFTITATALTAPSSGVTFNFATPTVSFVGAAPGTVDPVTFVSQSGNVATYTVTIASSSVGTFVINASDVVSFTDGFGDTTTVTATTSGTGGNSGPATKNYVNANISVGPNGANPVGTPHTFTITVTALTAASSGVTFNFATPTVTFVGAAPGTVGPVTFVSQTGNVATYTVTINSSTPGSFTIDATDTVSFTDPFSDTTTVTATTNGTGGNSGPATKNYDTITTSQSTTSTTVGSSISDTATVSGLVSPTGTVTFYLYNNATASGTPLYTSPAESLTSTGTPGVYTASSPGYTTTATGTDYWVATFSGDTNNAKVSSGTSAEQVTVSPAGPQINTTPSSTSTTVTSGQYATIGFWHNKNGQAVINNFDSGPSSTLLGKWLATNFPNLFGSPNPYDAATLASFPGSPTTFNGLTNAQVATVYENLWTPSGVTKNTYVQAFAVALGAYTSNGVGSFNVGGNGAAFGGSNNASLSVFQILTDVNSNFSPSTGNFYAGNQNNTSAANNVLDAINTSGETAGGTTVSTTVTLNDKAFLTGGLNPTGTITFYLFAPGVSPTYGTNTNAVYTDTVTVNGDGTYNTGTGTITGSNVPTQTGTYEWVAIYSGDTNNSSVTSPFGSEPWTVGQQSPTFFTVPGGSVVLGSGTKLTDSATLADGSSPTGTITFYLFAPGVTPNANNSNNVYSDAVTVSGNGTYMTSQGTNPGGYLPTVTGNYEWVAIYSGDANNAAASDSFGNEPETVSPPPPPPSITVVKTADQASITAGQTAGYTVTITNNGTVTDTSVSLSDPLPAGTGGDINWTIDTTVDNPLDFVITGSLGSQSLALSSSFISGGDSLAPGQSISVHITSPTNTGDASGSVNPALGVLGQYVVLFDSGSGNQLSIANDTVSGNIGVYGPGSVQFSGPGAIGGRVDFSAANTGQFHNTNGSNVGPTSVNYNVAAVTTARNLEISLSGGLGGLTGTNLAIGSGNQSVNESAGTLQTYGGVSYRVFNVTSYAMTAGHNLTIVGDGSGDPVLFNLAYNSNSNINGGVILAGSGLSDDLVMWNFTSSGRNIQMAATNGTFVGVMLLPNDAFVGSSVNIDGRIYGGAGGNMQIVSGTNVYAPPGTGTLVNTATVSASGTPPEQSTATTTITPSSTMVAAGGFATMGFWHNKNGQAVIDSFNGSSTSTALGNWLAKNYPNLFGTFKGQTNAQIAADFLTAFGNVGGVQGNTYAQTFSVALGVYADTAGLGYDSTAALYGFKQVSGGGGNASYNVGSNGAAFGVANNTTLTVFQILQTVNSNYNSTTGQFYGGSQSLTGDANNVTNGINQKGDIS